MNNLMKFENQKVEVFEFNGIDIVRNLIYN